MFAKITIRTKITALVAALLIALSGLGALAVVEMRSLNAASTDIATNWLPSVRILGEMRAYVLSYRGALRDHILAHFPVGRGGNRVFVGSLHRVQRAQDLGEVAAHDHRIDQHHPDLLVRADDEGGAD